MCQGVVFAGWLGTYISGNDASDFPREPVARYAVLKQSDILRIFCSHFTYSRDVVFMLSIFVVCVFCIGRVTHICEFFVFIAIGDRTHIVGCLCLLLLVTEHTLWVVCVCCYW